MTINLMFALYIGCSNILIADPRQFNTVISALKRKPDVSIIIAVNTLLNAFVTHDVFKKVKLKKLRLVVGGGTAVQEGVARKFKEHVPLEAINKELSRHESNSQQAIIMELSCEESCCSAA